MEGHESWYDSTIDWSVSNNAHTQAYELMRLGRPGERLRILDVGCASGTFAAALRRAGHEVWGIERSAQAEAARGAVDRLIVGTVEDFLDSEEGRLARFDRVVFIDVLEHLVDPGAVLRRCRALLHPGGAVVASIPNVAHLAVRVMLLEGRWDYADLGILDRTHLRFFTRRSIEALMADAGLTVDETRTVTMPVAAAGIGVDPDLLRRASRLVKDDDALVFQYVVRARPAEEAVLAPPRAAARASGRRPLRVICVEAQADWSIGSIRFRAPLAEWRRLHGGEFEVTTAGALDHRQMRAADVIVFQREAPAPLVELAADLQRLGTRVVFELDDLLTEVPPFLAVHAHSVAARPDLERMLRLADAVTVTTPRLARKLAHLNPRVFVVPNCSAPTAAVARHGGGPATLLLASSDTVRVDFVEGALGALARDASAPVRIVAVGPPGERLAGAGVPVERHALMGLEAFKLFAAGLDDPIGVIPLDASEFSACKSAIKFVDYALAGVPSVCSDVPPYTDVVRHGETGLLVPNRHEAWLSALRGLAASAQERRRLAAAARADCLERFSLRAAADAWADVFEAVTSAPPSSRAAGIRAPFRRLQPAVRRLLRPASYANGLRIARAEGIAGVVSRLRFYLGGSR